MSLSSCKKFCKDGISSWKVGMLEGGGPDAGWRIIELGAKFDGILPAKVAGVAWLSVTLSLREAGDHSAACWLMLLVHSTDLRGWAKCC